MAKKNYALNSDDVVVLEDDLKSVDAATDPSPSGLLKNADLDKSIVKVTDAKLGPVATALDLLNGEVA